MLKSTMKLFFICFCCMFYHCCAQREQGCACNVPWFKRTGCRAGRDLGRGSCIERGCCYKADTNIFNVPRCFEKTGTCPNSRCNIRGRTESCLPHLNRRSITKTMCEQEEGCCYNRRRSNVCFRAANASSTTAPPRKAMNDDTSKLSDVLVAFGPILSGRVCQSVQPCGRRNITEKQCKLLNCCWDNDFSRLKTTRCFIARLPTVQPSAKPKLGWSEWTNWNGCEGNPCETGTQFRTRRCLNEEAGSCGGAVAQRRLCQVACGQRFSWTSWTQQGSCLSPDRQCQSGFRREKRKCVGANGSVVPKSYCPGGRDERIASCNRHLCSSFTDYEFTSCSSSCGNGLRMGRRTCNNPVSNLPGKCLRTIQPCQSEPCTAKAFWSDWIQDGSCNATEPECTIGNRTEVRICFDANENAVSFGQCPGGEAMSRRARPCNVDYCDSLSPFSFGPCSVSCGAGVRIGRRSCNGGNPSGLPSQCLQVTEECVLDPCPSKLIDLIFVVDTSSSIGLINFNLVTNWLSSVALNLHVENGNEQVGMVRYGTFATTIIPLGPHDNNRQLATAIHETQFVGGGSGISQAIIKTAQQDFQVPNSRYPVSRKRMVVLHEGSISNERLFRIAVKEAAIRDIDLIFISIRPEGDVLDLISSVGNFISVDSYDDLSTLTFPLLDFIRR